MNLPEDAELLGANAGELEINGLGAHTIIRLNAGVQPLPSASPANASAPEALDRLCLIVENIRGTRDATVLNVYLNLPETETPGAHRELLAGSIGLFGLRMASIQPGEDGSPGLTSILDVTKILIGPNAAASPSANEIRVSIVPSRPLPEASGIVIGRIRLFRQTY
jgi:tyrosinase